VDRRQRRLFPGVQRLHELEQVDGAVLCDRDLEAGVVDEHSRTSADIGSSRASMPET